jgi:hypothetical protein
MDCLFVKPTQHKWYSTSTLIVSKTNLAKNSVFAHSGGAEVYF